MLIPSLRRVWARRVRPSAVLAAVALLSGVLPALTSPSTGLAPVPPVPKGYWLVASDGGVFSYGDTSFFGSTGAIKLNQPVVGMAATPSGKGYRFVAADGGIFSFGDASFEGSTGAIKLNKPIVGMATTPSGKGYWLAASDGGIFAFGDAAFFGSTGAITLNKPIVGMSATPSGKGYWLVASDGGVFSFGDAAFFGSTGAIKLNKPIVGMASTPSGKGYWMVASDGGMFSYGDAAFWGSAAATGTKEQIVGMVATPTGAGYWQMGANGTVFNFGDAPSLGFPGRLNAVIVGAAGLPARAGNGGTTVPGNGGTATTGPTGTTGPGNGLITPAEKGRPNIMIILMDDLRAPGVADRDGILTKTKSWLLDHGTRYTEGYSTTPLCCPERATIWTGRLSHNHGVLDNDTGVNVEDDFNDASIPAYLRQAGYHTSLVGKFITNWHGRTELLDPLFDEYAALQGGYRDTNFKVKDPGAAKASSVGTNTIPTNDSTDFIRDKAIQYLDSYETDAAKDAQPWFMQVAPHAPHDETEEPLYTWPSRYDDVPVPPFVPGPNYTLEGAGAESAAAAKAAKADKIPALARKSISLDLVQTEQVGQAKTLMVADDAIDEIMKALERNGELDNTLIIFTSDNGYYLGERGVDSKGWPYGEGVSVPFWVRWPGVIGAGVSDARPVGGEDILPTLLDAAQFTPAPLKYEFDGQSFLPGKPVKPYKYLEFGPPAGPNPEGYAGHRDINAWASLRTPTYQYIEYYQNDCADDPNPDSCVPNGTVEFAEYYDLVADPWQLDNLLSDTVTGKPRPDQATIDELHARVQAGRVCAGRSGPTGCQG